MRLVVDGTASGASNMAVDEALLESSREGRVTVRFYGFSPPCLSLGRNERGRGRWDEVAAARAGVDIVRRPTGGRAVFHSAELTYAVCAPAELWGGLRESYRRIHRGLVDGLRELDVAATSSRREGRGSRPGGEDGAGRSCFTSPAVSEVVADGRKLVGSAQWRHRGALLQHGSLLLRDEQGRMRALQATSSDGAEAPAGGADSGPSAGDGPRASTAAPGGGAAAARLGPPPGGGAGPPGAGVGGSSGIVAATASDQESDTGAVGLQELMPALPPMDVLIRALARGLAGALGRKAEPGELDAAERARAAALEARYRSRDWTWRR